MGRSLKRALAIMLVLLQIPLFLYPDNRLEAATEITPLQYYEEQSYRYFVGMMYYEMWKKTDGSWTDGGRKPNAGMRGDADFTYKFQFPGRKIKTVEARIYNPENDKVEYFEKSRSDKYLDYKRSISFETKNSDIKPFQKQGIGTDTTVIPITINMLLNAEDPKDIKKESCPSCAPEVEAYRIFVPILFKIELATQLNVKYFTTDGKSLNSIFTPVVNEEMTVGKEYVFTPPTHKDYEYVGFKKSTTDKDPSGVILRRDPDKLTYNGTHEKYTLHMYYQTKKTEPCKPGDPACEPTTSSDCTDPAPSSTVDGKVMDPRVTAMIKADQRGNERFDVTQGIPTSESLYGNVSSLNYLFENKFVQKSGKCTFKVNVEKSYTLKWDPGKTVTGPDGKPKQEPDPQTETETKVFSVTVERPYSFWTIDTLHVLKIDEANLVNYALPNGGIKISPSGYSPPGYAASTRGKYYPPKNPGKVTATPETKTGGKTKPAITDTASSVKSFAENAIDKVEVENDYLQFNGSTIMDNRKVKETGPSPGRIPDPTVIGQNVLYSPGNMISSTKVNKANTPSSGSIKFGLMSGNINDGEDKTYPIYGINSVTVHTPVVMYPTITDDQPHNQRVVPDMARAALILNRPFTVTLPTTGQHTNYPGYGNRDYAKYTQSKQVQFPFDVFNSTKSKYILKNTWIDIPVSQLQETFIMPVWIDEGNYTVLFRSFTENAPSDFSTQPAANTNWQHHVAINTIDVNVIGRLYDFRITDISDFDWETVFRKHKGSREHSGNVYWVGDRDIDGNLVGNRNLEGNRVSNATPLQLPIRPGSHPNPGYRNVTVKTGYPFKFDFKTSGNMFGANDKVRIVPSFFFVNKDGSGRIPVDLYYHDYTRKKYFVKIGSKDDVSRQTVKLDDPMRSVPKQEIIDSANFAYDNYGGQGLLRAQFVEKYLREAKKETLSGYNSQLMLTYPLRTFIGSKSVPSTVNVQRANASIQKWYGEYYLPPAMYVVKAGTNIAEYGRTHGGLNDKSPIFLKNGYIVVNFNIETIRNNNANNPYLRYYRLPGQSTPLDNQWKMEGFKNQQVDRYGNVHNLSDGDVLYYHADLSYRDDFTSTVPH
ncbi:DUF5704 domain-containing protein [Paenibacillus alvei]|uniref:DUF5704 domain-containing protein n=2 Tax=Paenibacillus alvei TaxID=44250 RepID=UPI00227DB19D|nr:DUF5704 domain-containing protein [Paenibacillus alvei]MCY9540485.1 DUF5704 domain-containing protein [Paenibacillus alvei]MCY9708310.1 DUF5704 domain-containing protein [Paenibacillus alvei]MCY9733002.1 DUF5704 domain-containing protein [Paenibacillus alvei]MCY9755232.1 DUF5704 domain-containing protein [Paenibacillus alvei]MEC0080290.1 DUF5704 domain-containing protein [Paenibacillus alvei]